MCMACVVTESVVDSLQVLGSVLSSRYVGVDSHQPTTSSEEIDFDEEQLPEPQPREAVAVETVEEEAAVSKEYGAGDHGEEGAKEDSGKEAVEEGNPSTIKPVGSELATETSEIPAVLSWETSEDPSSSSNQRDSGPHTPTADPPESDSETSTPVHEHLGKGKDTEVNSLEIKGSEVKILLTSNCKVAPGYLDRGYRDESGSTLSSDDEWDESLLPPR